MKQEGFNIGDRVVVVDDYTGAFEVAMKGDTGTVMEDSSYPWVMMDRSDERWTDCERLHIPANRGEVFSYYDIEKM